VNYYDALKCGGKSNIFLNLKIVCLKNIAPMKKRNYKKYAFEFLSIFVAVVAAFALNNWNDNRRDHHAEVKILTEIKNGLKKDIEDVRINVMGHEQGIAACQYFSRLINDDAISQDSFAMYYFGLTRDFITILNKSGYESLKSKGLNILQNDSLRYKIISFYEYDMNVLEKFEEEYEEMQFHKNYFPTINKILAPSLQFADRKVNPQLPLMLSVKDKNLLASYLWRIKANRNFILYYYADVEEKITKLVEEIEKEINH
jgi:hypothetical protein